MKSSAFMLAFVAVAFASSDVYGNASNRIKKREAAISALQKKNEEDKIRLENVKEVEAEMARIESMSASNLSSATAKCKAIQDVSERIKRKQSPKKSPFDGKGMQFKNRLNSEVRKTLQSAKGLTCQQINFFVDDSNADE